MKILDILEEKFSPSTYAYHATDGRYLRSILKQGLIPNKAKGGYGSSETSSNFGYSLSPLPGVYFTNDMQQAEHIAKQVEGSPLIVIAKIQKRDTSLDEDRLASEIIDERGLLKSIRQNEASIRKNPQPFIDSTVNNIIQNKLPQDISPKLVQNIRPELTKYVELLTKMQGTDELGDWSSEQWNNAVKNLQIDLTKKLKNILHRNDSKQNTFKVDGPVGFSGANRIVGLYNYISGEGWGDLGPFERDAYHKVKTPIELVKQ